jgi:hypothetical protein
MKLSPCCSIWVVVSPRERDKIMNVCSLHIGNNHVGSPVWNPRIQPKSFRHSACSITDSELCIADDTYLRTDTKPPKLGKG